MSRGRGTVDASVSIRRPCHRRFKTAGHLDSQSLPNFSKIPVEIRKFGLWHA